MHAMVPAHITRPSRCKTHLGVKGNYTVVWSARGVRPDASTPWCVFNNFNMLTFKRIEQTKRASSPLCRGNEALDILHKK